MAQDSESLIGMKHAGREIGSTLLLLTLVVLFDRLLRNISHIPVSAGEQQVLVVALLKHVSSLRWQLLLVLPVGILFAFKWREATARWSAFEHGSSFRLVAGGVAFMLAWQFCTYDYSLYLDRSHLVDRALVFALFAAVLFRPVFLLPFLIELVAIMSHFNGPAGEFSWTVPALLIRVLLLGVAALLLTMASGNWSSPHLMFALCCLIAAHYWPSGLGKLRHGWVFHDRVFLLLPVTYANGWLGFLEPETINSLTVKLAKINLPMKVFSLALECGALFILINRVTLKLFFAAAIAFHVGIFLVTGICLWQWVGLAATLLVVLYRNQHFPPVGISSKWVCLASIVLIGAAPLWLNPVSLSWADASATYTYRFEAVGASGQRYQLPPQWFAPYDQQFTFGSFGFLSPTKKLQIVWGATDRETAEHLAAAKTAEQILAVEQELGSVQYDEAATQRFKQFLRQFVANHNKRRDHGHTRRQSWLRAPPLLWTFPRQGAYRGQESIQRVAAYEVLSCFCDGKYHEIRSIPLFELDIPGADG